MLNGCNATVFHQMQENCPKINAWREYFTADAGNGTGVPTAWPQSEPSAATGIVSFRPGDQILTGAYDTALESFLSGAPAGSWLVDWHEKNLPSAGFWGTAAQAVAVDVYLSEFIRVHGYPITFGQIFSTYQPGDASKFAGPWVCPGLDFYGMDGYQAGTNRTPTQVFGQLVNDITDVYSNADLAITETNTQAGTPDWYLECFGYAVNHQMLAWLTFWGFGAVEYNPAGLYVPALANIAEIATESI